MFATGKKLQKLQEQIDLQRNESSEFRRRYGEDTENLARGLETLRQAVQKHDMAIADMLDTWDEWREQQAEQADSLRDVLSQKTQAEIGVLREREETLLDGLITAYDQLFQLCAAADSSGNEIWRKQLRLAEAKLNEKCLRAGLQVTGLAGESFSYDLHEPLEKLDTALPDQHLTVAEVFSPGYWYHGKLLRKAKVSVYYLKETES